MTGIAVVAETAANGATAGSSPGRGLMVDHDRSGPIRNDRTATQARISAPLSRNICKFFGCTRSTRLGSDYCSEHRPTGRDQDRDLSDLVERSPQNGPQRRDPARLKRIERKLDALLDRLDAEEGGE